MNIEVTSSRFQKIAAVFIFILVGGIAAYGLLHLVSDIITSNKPVFVNGMMHENMISILVAAGLFILGFYIFLTTIKFRLYANDKGVGQTNGLKGTFIPWERISSYTIETLYSRQRISEPVLRDSNNRIILKPLLPGIINTSQDLANRAYFWHEVTKIIDKNRGNWR